MLAVIVLYMLLFVIAGTKYKRKTCLLLWILFALATCASTYFLTCELCLSLLIIAAVVVVVTLIELIIIWKSYSGKYMARSKKPLVRENLQSENIKDDRLYVTIIAVKTES